MAAKGKLVGGLATVGVAAVALFPASAGAQGCVTECGGVTGLTTALVTVASVGSGTTTQAVSVIEGKLAGNHNETVLLLD